MGIQNRDYIRERERQDGMGGSLAAAPVVKWIVISTVAVYLLQMMTMEPALQSTSHFHLEPESQYAGSSLVQRWLCLDVDKVLQGQIWRLVTCAWVHAVYSIWHIAMNMIILVWLGRSLEFHYGSREFGLFYLAAVMVASLSHIGLQLALGERVPAIGASGGVMAVFCLFALWNPGYTIAIYFLFPVPVIWLLGLYVLYDLHPVLLELAGTPDYSGVAHAAHLGGIAFAFLYYHGSWSLERRIAPLTTQRHGQPRPMRLTPHRQAQQDREDLQVDEILTKISVQGEASLTNREREILLAASARYKAKSQSTPDNRIDL
jgi:membrane associated rhomboid family serine protease